MAFDTKDLEEQSLKAIKEHNLFFINDLTAYLPCSRQTFYEHGLDKLDSIKSELEKNRINVKNGLRAKWYKSVNSATQIALYKLIADDDERKKISQGYTDITSGGETIKGATIEFADKPEDSHSDSELPA